MPATRPRTRPRSRVLYRTHARELTELATSQCGLSDADARELVHAVLLSALLRVGSSDLRMWLRGAVICAARRLKESSR